MTAWVRVHSGHGEELVTRILWGDDRIALLGAVRALLESHFELVGAVEDGAAALEAARALEPDVVVLDISMPKLTGIEVARHLQKDEGGPAIVFLTVHADLEIVEAALETGALGYVLKIYAGRELIMAIDEALAGRRYISQALREAK